MIDSLRIDLIKVISDPMLMNYKDLKEIEKVRREGLESIYSDICPNCGHYITSKAVLNRLAGNLELPCGLKECVGLLVKRKNVDIKYNVNKDNQVVTNTVFRITGEV